ERLERLNVETLERSTERSALREQMSAVQSRLRALQEMEASFEGLFAGVRAVMQAQKQGHPLLNPALSKEEKHPPFGPTLSKEEKHPLFDPSLSKKEKHSLFDPALSKEGKHPPFDPALSKGENLPPSNPPLAKGGIQGRFVLVADVLRVPPPFETAIEVGLGSALQHIIAPDEQSVKDAIHFLKATQSGRATFLPLPLLRPASLLPQTRQVVQRPGVCGIAVDLVQFDEVYRPVAEYLLNRLIVVQNLDVALTLSRHVETGCRLVTLEGELVLPAGAITGGAGKQRASGLLQRKREIEELDARRKTQNAKLAELESQLTALQDEVVATQAQLRALEQTRVEHLALCARHEREMEHLEREQRRLEQTLERLNGETLECSNVEQESRQQEERLRVELRTLEEAARAVEAEIERLQSQWTAQQTQREELSRQVAEIQAHQAAVQERSAAVERSLAQLEQQAREFSETIESRRVSIARALEEEARLAQQIAADEQNLAQLTQVQVEKEQAFEAWRRERHEILQRLEATTQSLRQQRQTLHQIEEEMHRIELRETQTHTEMEEMQRRFREEFNTTAEDALPRKDDIESKQLALDEIAVIKENMAAMGEVNLGAISQQQQLTERLDFLRTQRDDLERAQADLESIIADIDQRTRDQFMQTFHAVAREFDALFKRLFDGGETRLSLTDPDNLLDTGIDVRVQPPGKAAQDLMLLSGGERALTALALMLALLRVKPSPFVVLDEVDAPLDETNIGRFTELLHEFADTSQFIIITHNKGTMEAADALYGVTMEEHGVSKLVSVRLTDAGQENGARNGSKKR
ncbi:MAG: chromosome segregation protein SMC, partial [Abditibacteriales bacterium]|nr:chromosome segregation protein SMC [Abditibacteriales bacterium]MDW8365874.1 chromosome segregation protein SMC [Abditibacteriales bacterium]